MIIGAIYIYALGMTRVYNDYLKLIMLMSKTVVILSVYDRSNNQLLKIVHGQAGDCLDVSIAT